MQIKFGINMNYGDSQNNKTLKFIKYESFWNLET